MSFGPNPNQPPEPANQFTNPYAFTNPPVEDQSVVHAESSEKPPVEKTGHPWVAWTVILCVVAYILALPHLAKEDPKAKKTSGGDVVGLKLMEVQGKYFVGAMNFLPIDDEQQEGIYESTSELNRGTLEQRFRYIVLAGELAGADEAALQLTSLNHLVDSNAAKTTPEQDGVRQALQHLYADYREENWDAPSLDENQRQLLEAELGWFGALALAPATSANQSARDQVVRPARQTFFGVFGIIGMMVLMGGVGLIGLCVFVVLALTGKVKSRIDAGRPHGGVYAETFAVWMILFVGLSMAAAIFSNADNHLTVTLAAFSFSLMALAWSVLRGVTWKQVRQDIGLTIGKHVVEPFWGFVCYMCTIPLLVGGVIVMLILMSVFGFLLEGGGPGSGDVFAPTNTPSHPIIEWIAEADFAKTMIIVLLACVAAPIVEEIMFRGVLYRQLRDATASTRVLVSVLFSGLVSSFIFAIIHPQGIFAVPPLMALAFGFAMAREWRGSLIAPMTMHALNNGIVTVLMLVIL